MLSRSTDASLTQHASDVEAASASSDRSVDAAATTSGSGASGALTGAQTGSSWTMRIRTMTGLELTVPCADLELTTIGHIKSEISELRSVWPVHQQCLMLPVGDHNEEPLINGHPSLNDDLTLLACGLHNGAILELLLKEDEWAVSDQVLLKKVRDCGRTFTLAECSNRECHMLARAVSEEVNDSKWPHIAVII